MRCSPVGWLPLPVAAGVVLLMAWPMVTSAAGQSVRFADPEGVLHITNVPSDPRYRGLVGDTTTGRLFRPPGRAERFSEAIQSLAREHGVDPELVRAVVMAESAFDPAAVSPRGAGGLMQLMPRTASALGVVDRFDPQENLRGGVRHLRHLLDRYGGNVVMALAAYNAGEAAVDAHRGVPPYTETRRYVQTVLREAGRTGSGRTVLYRSLGPDGSITYGNVPPAPTPSRGLRPPTL